MHLEGMVCMACLHAWQMIGLVHMTSSIMIEDVVMRGSAPAYKRLSDVGLHSRSLSIVIITGVYLSLWLTMCVMCISARAVSWMCAAL
jgi:hypothetical protein